MKKNLFWKGISILFLIWLFLWLWNSSIVVIPIGEGRAIIKTNKLTGQLYFFSVRNKFDGWLRIDKTTLVEDSKKK